MQRCLFSKRTLRGRSLCFVLEMRNQVTPPDTCSVQAPSGGVTVYKINDPQCGLLLLRACTGISKLYFAMRTCSPQVFEMAQRSFDAALRCALKRIVTASGQSASRLSCFNIMIFVAGHRGLVGSAVVRRLQNVGYTNLILRSHTELDLTNVKTFFSIEKPQYVILAAAKVGGIHANSTYPADFITVNLQIQTNVIDYAYRYEPTNEWYNVAKIAGIKMCQAYRIQYKWYAISAMPTNLYGPNDNFHPENSHVLPAFDEAVSRGEIVLLLENYSGLEHENVGSGKEVSIKELAELVKEVVGFAGELVWDSSKPDGTPRKLMVAQHLLNWVGNQRSHLRMVL
ncbi:putative GDP-L-fucose synthase 2 [Tanacetum coccineum]|uniref:GDP-L-fucose synthase 2 n=1 Tax=Tanacetum coccineum TaxID=301880 RepID=A0ABQ5GIM8_9ASTR